MVDKAFLRRSYESYAAIEEQFNELLDRSLNPRGPDLLFEIVAGLRLSEGAEAIDAGCGEGAHAIELARRFKLNVLGFDPVERNIALARERLELLAQVDPLLLGRVRFQKGEVESLPAADSSIDLLWCRDVLVHVENLGVALLEFSRILKPAGRALLYQTFATDRIEAREADWLFRVMGCKAGNMDPSYAEAAIAAAGLNIEACHTIGSEWGEYGQETAVRGGRKLLHAARLERDSERYIRQFGLDNYEIALGDALWHVYRLIGKLTDRVYLLSPAP